MDKIFGRTVSFQSTNVSISINNPVLLHHVIRYPGVEKLWAAGAHAFLSDWTVFRCTGTRGGGLLRVSWVLSRLLLEYP